MKKIFTLFSVLSLFSLTAYSQTPDSAAPKYWTCTGIVGLNGSGVGLWNWAEGGNPSASIVTFANVTLTYKKNKIQWQSNLDSDFGMMYSPNVLDDWRKSNDKIIFNTQLGYEFRTHWYVAFLGSFRSQYSKGYDYIIKDGIDTKSNVSNWLSPSYTDLGIGIDYRPNDIFSLYLSPISGKIITAMDSNLRSRYGVAPDETFTAHAGLLFKGGINYTRVKNLKVITTLTLFTPYSENFGNFDVTWDLAVSYQFLKVLNVTLGTSLLYYNDIMIANKQGELAPRTQFKSMLGIGIGYNF